MNNLLLSVEKLNDAQQCPCLYNYKHNLRLVPEKKAPWFETGDLMHRMLEHYYRAKLEKATLPIDTIVDLGRNHAAKTLSITAEDVETVIRDFRMYVNYYSGGKESWLIRGVEEPFAKILWEGTDLRIVINGKNDLRIATMNGKGPVALVDHKYEDRFYQKPDRDNQPLCYCWAYDINDFMYNRIGKQKSLKVEERLVRPYFNYTKYQIEEWKESAIDTAIELFSYYQREKFPMRFKGCHPPHNARCDFYDVCNTSPDNREYKLNSFFKNRKDSKLMEGK